MPVAAGPDVRRGYRLANRILLGVLLALTAWNLLGFGIIPGGSTRLPHGILGPTEGLYGAVHHALHLRIARAVALHPSGPALAILLVVQLGLRSLCAIRPPDGLARHWPWDLGLSVTAFILCLVVPLAVVVPDRLLFRAALSSDCRSTLLARR